MLSFRKIRDYPMGRQVCLTTPSEDRSGGGGPFGGRLYHCGKAVGEVGVMLTLAQSGSTKTGPFHGLRRYPTHAVNPPHTNRKRKSNVHHYCKSDDFRAGFKIAEWRVFCHSAWLQISPARFKQVCSDSASQPAPP
jgi:hypothetical protein